VDDGRLTIDHGKDRNMPKSSKRFVLNDHSINRDGFMVLSDGIDMSSFEQNPIMLWMHNRASNGKTDDVLPLGYWEDVELKDGVLSAVPNFDDDDPFAMSIYNKVEKGVIRSCSMGLTPVNVDVMSMKEIEMRAYRSGRGPSTGETIDLGADEGDSPMVLVVMNSRLNEASIVDIGSNANSVVLMDESQAPIKIGSQEEMLKLFAKEPKQNKPMLELKALASELNLAADADLNAVVTAVKTLKTAAATAEQKVKEIQLASVKKDIDVFLSAAVAAKKITEAQKPHYLKLSGEGGENFETVKELVNALPEYVSLAAATTAAAEKGSELDDLMKLSYDELDRSGKVIRLKALSEESFKLKYKEHFGTEYKK
jgi:hypothetical protein